MDADLSRRQPSLSRISSAKPVVVHGRLGHIRREDFGDTVGVEVCLHSRDAFRAIEAPKFEVEGAGVEGGARNLERAHHLRGVDEFQMGEDLDPRPMDSFIEGSHSRQAFELGFLSESLESYIALTPSMRLFLMSIGRIIT